MSATLIDARAQWLAQRRELITAADAAAIIGADPRRGPLAVWAEKVGQVEVEETIPMRRGRRLESAIVEEYAEQTGRAATPWPAYEILIHPTIPWLGATLDATTIHAAPIPLEIKLALGSAGDWREEPPLAHQCQAQVQAQCFEAQEAALAGLIGPGPLKVYDLPRDDAFFALLVPRLEKFRWHVETKTPPEADGKAGTTDAIKALWSGENGDTVALDADTLDMADKWEAALARSEAAGETAQELENKLRARIGAASFGALTDGSFLALRVTKVKGYTRTVQPTSYRRLRRFRPRLKRR